MPTQSLAYILICSAGIIFFIFMIIIPNQNTAAELEEDTEKLKERIEQQRILRPVFDSLLERAKRENPTQLPATKKVKLELGDINKLTGLLKELASRHNLEIRDIQTDVNAMMSNTGFMMMRINATGEFMKFRDFLLDLGTIPSLEQIEEIAIQAIDQNREFRLKIWLSQSEPKSDDG